MDDKRKFQRFPVELEATYCINGTRATKKCRITDISREGAKLEMRTREKVNAGDRLKLKILFSPDTEPVKCIVDVLWIEKLRIKNGFQFVCGGQYEVIRNRDKWQLLDIAYDAWKEHSAQE